MVLVKYDNMTRTLATLGLILWLVNSTISNLLDANKLADELTKLANDGLGVQKMQDYFNALEYSPSTLDGSNLINTLRSSMVEKFASRTAALRDLKVAIEASYEQTPGTFEQCCQVTTGLQFNNRFGKELDPTTACTRISDSVSPNGRHLSHEVIHVMKENYRKIPNMKWQFYGSEDGIFTIYPSNSIDSCTGYDNRYRPFYVEGSTPQAKNLVIVIDKSASMRTRFGDKTLMQIAIDAATTLLQTLNPNDKVGVVIFSNEPTTLRGDGDSYQDCFSEQLALATLTNIQLLQDFISQLSPNGDTYYGTALQMAFNLLKASYVALDGVDREQIILFVTDGIPNDDKQDIMSIVQQNNEEMSNQAVILTIGIGQDEGLEFLKDLAEQRFEDYGLPPADSSIGEIKLGEYTQVTDYTKLRSTMARYYDFFANSDNVRDEPIFSVPYQDAFGLGLMTTAAMPVRYGGELKGVVGTDFTLDDLFGDITHLREGPSAYAFLFEANTKSNGRTLTHPLLPAPTVIEDDPVYVRITALEREREFSDIVFYNSTNGQDAGEATFYTRRSFPRGDSETGGVYTTTIQATYHWRKVYDSPYIVCLVTAVDDVQLVIKQQQPTGKDFLYHRLDLVEPPSSCRQGDRHATRAQSVVKLSPNAFQNPVDYLELGETEEIIHQYEDYMNDATMTVANRYFKNDIKDMVTATAKVNELWSKQNTEYDAFTLYRYIGTNNGVFRLYPGVRMNDLYDPTVRSWFERAKANRRDLTLSAQYQASSDSQNIITLSKSVKVSGTSDSTSEDIIAVMGMDITPTYVYNLVLQTYPECTEDRYSCFIMDSSGYLVVHEDFLHDEQQDFPMLHIVEMEPTIATDLISEGILRKEACLDLQRLRNRYYYTVETSSSTQDIDKLDDIDGCKRYQFTRIQATNAFLGVIDKTEGCAEVLCPCFYDRCLAPDPRSCECPCLSMTNEYDYCEDDYTFTSDSYPSCSPPSSSLSQITENLEDLANCYQADCNSIGTASECRAMVSCQWEMDTCIPTSPLTGQDSSNIIIIVVTVLVIVVIISLITIIVYKCAWLPWKSKQKLLNYTSNGVNIGEDNNSAPSAPPRPDTVQLEPVYDIYTSEYTDVITGHTNGQRQGIGGHDGGNNNIHGEGVYELDHRMSDGHNDINVNFNDLATGGYIEAISSSSSSSSRTDDDYYEMDGRTNTGYMEDGDVPATNDSERSEANGDFAHYI